MNSGQAHVRKRDIRRAFGDGAVQILKAHEDRIAQLEHTTYRTFWGRLRWFLFGR